MNVRDTFEGYAATLLPSFMYSKPPVTVPTLSDIAKEKFDQNNPRHVALIDHHMKEFGLCSDKLREMNNMLALGAGGVFIAWIGNLNNTFTLIACAALVVVDRLAYRHGDVEQAFSKSLAELHQLYKWSKAENPQHLKVKELKGIIKTYAQPEFKSLFDKVAYFFDASAKNVMMLRSGINFKDESLVKVRQPQK